MEAVSIADAGASPIVTVSGPAPSPLLRILYETSASFGKSSSPVRVPEIRSGRQT
jgi:hypothetical protein